MVLGLALSAGVAVAALAGAWWARQAEHGRAQDRARETARRAGLLVRRELDRSCEGAEAVAAFMGDGREVTRAEFERFAGRIVRSRPLRALAFSSRPASVARGPLPADAPAAAAGAAVRYAVPAGLRARAVHAGLVAASAGVGRPQGTAGTGRAEVGPPSALPPDGARGVLLTVPVAAPLPRGGMRSGVVLGAVPFSAMARALNPLLSEGVMVQLTAGGTPLLPGPAPPGGAERRAVRVGGQTWVAWAWGAEPVGHGLPLAVGGLGLAAAVLLGAVVLLGGRRERRVGESLTLRTRELAEREAQITAMALSAQDGLAICAPDGTILRINERFAEIVGHARAEVVGARPPHPWWLPADAGKLAAALRGAHGGRRGELESRIRRADGEERWIRLAYAPAGSGGGHVETLTDVTERRRAEDAERAQRDIATLIARGAAADQVFAAAARATRRRFGTSAALVVRFEPGGMLRVAGWDADPGVADPPPGHCLPVEPSNTAIAGVHRTGRAARSRCYDPAAGELDRVAAERGEAGVAVPVRVEGRLWGALGVVAARGAALPAGTEERLGRFAELIGVAIAQADAHAALEQRAMTDHLTGMPNHRAFHERLKAEVARARRSGPGPRDLCLAVVDIDGFKAANDVHGHEAGDALLGELAALLQAQHRPGDLVARVGGDEFGWLLPATSLEEAAAVVDRARAAVAHRRFPPAGRLRVSAGVAALSQAGGDWRRLSHLADGALYWAKVEGRDRVVAYDPQRVREHSPEERAERIRREQGLAALRARGATPTGPGRPGRSPTA